MFANKNLFDDSGEVDVDRAASSGYQNARPMTMESTASSSPAYSSQTFDRQPSGYLASSLGGGSANLEDLPATPTPAMRKQKMEEMRRAQLAKAKAKSMAAPTVLRHNTDQLKSSPAPAASPSAAAAPAPSPMYSPVSSPQFPRQGGAFGSSAAGSPRGDLFAHDNSDDEAEGAAVESLDPHINSLLAQKRADQTRKHISQAERDMLEQGIAPVFDPVKHLSPGVRLDFSDMRSFLVTPVPKGMLFQTYILRNKKGLKNKLYPTYECYMSGEEKFLLAARKRTKNKTSNYMISMDKNNVGGKESASYLGKVRSNFVGTEFITFDKGVNPSEVDAAQASISVMSVRQELAAVFYESNILGSKGPRKMTAVVPSVRKDGTRAVWKPLEPDHSVAVQYKANPNGSDYLTLVNKTPKWNDVAGAYVLNFNGRVTQASVKNFQLIHLDDPENVLLQFGRIGKDTFTMDLQWPLSPLQAFSIALTSFDYKFACE